ncbi:MAG: 30S ribosomal protein S5 [Flavobacteriales endosymbiont of Rhyzopertha dominica]|nr:MAG: 30S ribosomal protein S5 [Candidatus Shikimatogenerans bostrichidophilus]
MKKLNKKIKVNYKEYELIEKIVKIKRVCKVTKGRRDFSFSTILVKGNYNGIIGYGIGKSKDVSNSIYKANVNSNRKLIKIPIINYTIPYQQMYKYCSTKIYLYPAYQGTGIIAGNSARIVLELAGIKNIVSKFIGSTNIYNSVKATFYALKEILLNYKIFKKKINDNI